MSQLRTSEAPGRITPVDEYVNTLEVEAMAQRKLAPELFAQIAGSQRDAFERITFRPRMLIDTTKLDLSLDLLGHRHFAPILIGPVAQAQRFHPDGELALARGALAAKAVPILTQTPDPIATPLWLQVSDPGKIPPGAQALCLAAPFTWETVDQIRQATRVPLILKGITTPQDAQLAIRHGASAIVVSAYRPGAPPAPNVLGLLPEIAKQVAGQVPILIDGNFRRGSDIIKALALGARAVLIARPALWGLATHGDKGVQKVVEMLQSEVARDMAMLGVANLSQLTPAYLRLHHH
ncbi:MAG: alpha-hydroxy-acid oxidizing protein [Bryobacteraceae bacterium]|nr:alpha-hydroxy-acid oxidizing protein [Bryobacteraceae bacterium]